MWNVSILNVLVSERHASLCDHSICAITLSVRSFYLCNHSICANTLSVRSLYLCDHSICAITLSANVPLNNINQRYSVAHSRTTTAVVLKKITRKLLKHYKLCLVSNTLKSKHSEYCISHQKQRLRLQILKQRLSS